MLGVAMALTGATAAMQAPAPELVWEATGFTAPESVVYDAELVEIDPASGRIVARHAPPDGPSGFNDCTADSGGTVYVFSRRLSSVFRLRAGRFEPWVKVDATKTGWPNGLRVSADGVPTPLLTLRRGAADHEYVIEQRLLVVPLVVDGVVKAFRWGP